MAKLARVRSDLVWALHSLGPSAELLRVKPMKSDGHVVMHALEIKNRGVRRKLVLRRYIDLDWLAREPDLADREAKTLQVLENTPGLRTPKLVAVDPFGRELGWPTVLMARIEGKEHWKPPSIERFAAVAPRIHSVRAPRSFRPYRPYYDAATLTPPDWSSQPKLWEKAFEVAARATVDPSAVTFIHRDHHSGNVLWSYGRVSGVVDWVEACLGPPAVDFARARINLAAQSGIAAARRYAKCAGIAVDPLWDLVDACDSNGGRLPGDHAKPGLEAFVADALSELG